MRGGAVSVPETSRGSATGPSSSARNRITASPCSRASRWRSCSAACRGCRTATTPRRAIIEVRADGLTIGNLYLPNGNSGGDAGYAYKLRWMECLAARARRRCWRPTSPACSPATTMSARRTRISRPGTLPRRRRADPPGEPGRVPQNALARPDRRDPRRAAARQSLHVLGLPGRRLAARPRPAHRPRAALAGPRRASGVAKPDRDERNQPQPSDHVPVLVEFAA